MAYEEHQAYTEFASAREQRLALFLVFFGVLTVTYGALYIVDFLPEPPREAAVRTDAPERVVASVTETETAPVSAPDVHEGAPAAPAPNETRDTTEGSVPSTGMVVPREPVEPAPSTPPADSASVPVVPPKVEIVEQAAIVDPYPTRIIFDALDGRTVAVLNPEARSIEALDTALLSGVVRHPDSADFERTGTMFLFGHSSYLPNVINKNFQAFNGIQHMEWGDTIRLRSSDTEYVYRVDRVYEVSADVAEVKIETGTAKLTLVTCDSFGAKSDRFIVESTLVETRSLGGGVS